jgi:hypothetical protein
MNNVLMIFIDGVGIGKEDFQLNPFFKFGFKTFTEHFGRVPSLENSNLASYKKFLKPIDANLGVAGLPQSGTGQVSIFCGVNAAKQLGFHFGPFPHSQLIDTIKEKNIFKEFIKRKKKVFFANAYPKVFFDYIKQGKSRLSVTSKSCLLNELRLNTSTDVWKAKALTAEITNERWNKRLGYKLKIITPEGAAKRLLRLASNYHFTLYEFFLTDHLGHGRISDELESTHNNLDRFLNEILNSLDYKKFTLVICSDHGNYEDLSVKGHTNNPALFITAGRNADKIANDFNDLSQIKSAILKHCL